MTPPTERRAARAHAPACALLPAALFCLLCLGAPPAARADAPRNSIRSIRTVVTDRRLITYDITLTSSAEFPMGDAVVTLSIGGREFINSSYAPGGTLNTLVFSLTRGQFQALKSGTPVAVYYGADNAALPAARWDFGALDLGLLDKSAGVAAPAQPAPPVKGTLKAAKAAVKAAGGAHK